MSLDSLTLNGSAPVNWTASKNVTGASANTNSSSANEAKASLSTNQAGNAANGANELYYAILSIAASGNAQIDLTTFTDILNAAGVSAARVKFIQIELLSTTQDSVNGTNASSITIDATVTNALLSSSFSGWLSTATSKLDIPNGGWNQFGMTNANGTPVSGTSKVLKINNNDGTNAAAVKVIIGVSTV